ncbi:MAG: tyrosine-type recombinase/integrase [Anaerolineales bacterium]|nr:tyrosine-type recombinase/integrase [Anaerolineales bacterium]
MKIQQAVEVFFGEFHFPRESRNTRRTYQSALNKFLQYADDVHILMKEVSSLDSSIVTRFGVWLTGKGLTEDTQNIYETALRRAVNFWRIKGWIDFSNDEEKEARSAMRIQSKKKRSAGSVRVGRVPEDFGDKMAATADSQPLPPTKNRLALLTVLRSIALVHFLRATGLRIGDACRFTRGDFQNAKARDGYFTLPMQKTGSLAHCLIGEPAIAAIERYLKARADASPWVFIQHGRTGKPRTGTSQFFRASIKGYGSKISTKTAWEIIRGIGRQAYGYKTTQFISPHAFRHWHAQSLIRAGAQLEDVQSVLGHATPVITKQIYAPEPNLSRITETERLIQRKPKQIPNNEGENS